MRLIDADALIEDVKQLVDFLYSFEINELVECGRIIHNGIIQEVKMMPTIDAKINEDKHGEWLFEEYPDGYYHSECSLCGKWFGEEAYLHKWKYCPNCGEKMNNT